MTEDAGASGGGVIDRKSRPRRRRTLDELVAIVRPPGRPTEIRVFADDELDEAQRYASEMGTVVEHFPLS